jgi:hypothetical protein
MRAVTANETVAGGRPTRSLHARVEWGSVSKTVQLAPDCHELVDAQSTMRHSSDATSPRVVDWHVPTVVVMESCMAAKAYHTCPQVPSLVGLQ